MRKNTCKKWLVLLIASVLMLSLAACSASSNNANSDDNGSSGKLRIVWWGSQERHDATVKVLELYKEKNPDITFEMEYSGWDGYWDKLATQSAAKNAPDIIQMDAQFFQEYASRNQLAELDKVNTTDIDQSLVDSGKYNDKLYSIALGNNAYGLVYNKSVFEKLGVPLPEAGWTWDDLFNMAKEIQPKLEEGKYVLRDFTYDASIYEMYQLSKGKGHLSKEDGSFNIDKETWLEWVNIFSELRELGVVTPPDVTVSEQEYDPKQDLLLNNTVLIKQSFAAQFPSYDSVQPDTYELVKAPRSEEAGGYLKPSMFWAVSEHSKNKEEAQKFIDFFINDPEAAEILGVTRGIPVSNTILDSMKENFGQSELSQLTLIEETAPDGQIFNGGPKGWGDFQNNGYRQVGEELSFGQIEPEAAYEQLKKVFEDMVN
ncbi:ABC transporter substrate-binding protein [Sutcliffiella horikoshii]|uniref:ABC transporter substrate-binding protein n=1 Tax=Sutcliffiella horikoshii TaxID=79883 RepID=UPI001CFDB207|nr:extracellular solute-binding protein [Sutcliffiella horikoshii]